MLLLVIIKILIFFYSRDHCLIPEGSEVLRGKQNSNNNNNNNNIIITNNINIVIIISRHGFRGDTTIPDNHCISILLHGICF